MQVQPSPQQQQGPYHTHPPHTQPNQIYTNGSYAPDARAQSTVAGANAHVNGGDEMQPYHQQYQGAYGQQQAPRSYQAQGQLPSLQQMGAMGAPHMPSGSLPSSGVPPSHAAHTQQPHYLQGGAFGQPVMQQPTLQQQPNRTSTKQPVKLQHSGHDDKYQYQLVVEQQPQRARMCGFGDKDRRPITPPPCIRLLILDRVTGKEVDIDKVDPTFFVLQVDLWNADAESEVNIVRASSSSPAVSISTATTTSFPPTPDRAYDMPRGMMFPGADGGSASYAGFSGAYPGAPQYPGQPYSSYQPYAAVPYAAQQPSSNNMMFTRNLIGSLTVNASRLNDPNGKPSCWFVLQDLSVRTEGHFRLKMNFIDVGASTGSGLNRGRAPVLAYVFSDKFQVYSAKKFPGVIESTPLSKCFAGQGIKIPIRKDNAKTDGNSPED